MARPDRMTRLQLLGLVDSKASALQAVVDRHSILLGKLIGERGLGNILYGMEDPTQKVQILVATATSSLTLTTAFQSITGDGNSSKVRIVLPTIGDWLIEAVCDFDVTATDPNACIGDLYVDDSGSAESSSAIYWPGSTANLTGRATVTQRWKVTTTAINTPVELKARKNAAGGTAYARSSHTRLTAIGGAGSADIRFANHGLLEGLSDIADHPYAALIDGSRDFTGDQSMGSNKLTSLAAPTDDNDAARKTDLYTDTEAVTAVPFIQYIPFGSEPITGQSYSP